MLYEELENEFITDDEKQLLWVLKNNAIKI